MGIEYKTMSNKERLPSRVLSIMPEEIFIPGNEGVSTRAIHGHWYPFYMNVVQPSNFDIANACWHANNEETINLEQHTESQRTFDRTRVVQELRRKRVDASLAYTVAIDLELSGFTEVSFAGFVYKRRGYVGIVRKYEKSQPLETPYEIYVLPCE